MYDVNQSALESVTPSTLMTYLEICGWNLVREEDYFYRYRRSVGDRWTDIMVPKDRTFSDYPEWIHMAVKALSKFDHRPAQDILEDIMSGNVNDMFQYRILTEDDTGTIRLDRIIQILEAHRAMSAAAYMDAVSPSPYHRNLRRGRQAMRGMRMGQTSLGSFVLRVMYPQEPEDGSQPQDLPGGDDVMVTIARRVLESSAIVSEAARRGKVPDPETGISYNFVDSFLDLDQGSGQSMEMSTFNPRYGQSEKRVEVTERTFSDVRRVADAMEPKEVSQLRDFTGRIYESRNLGEEDDSPSRFRMDFFDDDGSYRRAVLELDGEMRRTAIEAMMGHRVVTVRGRLEGHGGSKRIGEPESLRVVL